MLRDYGYEKVRFKSVVQQYKSKTELVPIFLNEIVPILKLEPFLQYNLVPNSICSHSKSVRFCKLDHG